MTYEKEIPAYAMQVAKAPKTIPCQAVYHTENIVSPGGVQTVRYQFEEDILVPDIKEDMAEILLMTADCDLIPTERKLSNDADELLHLTGTVTIQTLYRPEKDDCLPVSITSKVPYQFQWHMQKSGPAEGLFSGNIRSLEYMIINERKFRVKITLEFTCNVLLQQELSLFQGLEQENLEMKREAISLCCLTARKKEQLDFDDWIELTGTKDTILEILQQHYLVTENYKQVTSEKVVINGFLFAEFLCRAQGEDGEERLCCTKGRLEFTQFVPLEKKYRGKKWSLVKTSFHHQGLCAVLEKKEDDQKGIHVKGRLETDIFLYEDVQMEMVTDAYHQTKPFTCRFETQKRKGMICASASEMPFRELLHLQEGQLATEAVSVQCRPVQWTCGAEKGRLRMTVEMEAVSLWRNEDTYQKMKSLHKLEQFIDVEGMEAGTEVSVKLSPKDCRLTLLGERQLELSGSLYLSCEGSCEKELQLLEEPAFLEGDFEKTPAMVIAAVEEGEDLWSLAKRTRTTEDKIRKVNRLEGKPARGQKLLIMK